MSSARTDPPVRHLSIRLTLWHSFLFMGSAVVLLAVTYLLLRNRAVATDRFVVDSRTNQYLSEYKNAGLPGVQRLATLRRGRAQQAFFVRVADSRNQTVFLRHAEDWAEFRPETLNGQGFPPSGTRQWQTLPSSDGTELFFAAERLPDGGVLQVGKANEEVIDLLAGYRRSCLLVLLIFAPASFIGGAFVTSRALRPVRHLTAVAQEIVDTNRFDARVPSAGTRDELDALGQVFNKMLQRIDSLVRGMREALDNVAHDLRTPLTRLRHQAQGVLEAEHERSSSPPCPHCRITVEALADCVEEADRVGMVLDTLMDIAEAESGSAKLEVSPQCLASVVDQVVESYAEFAEERSVHVTANVPRDLRVSADAASLSRVLANLLDNGIKYTPAEGSVRVTAERVDSFIKICFADSGVGIPADELPRVWDRLFRSKRCRSERGLGLGLSFVRALVEAHGGKAVAESELGTGTTVRIFLPKA